MSRSEKGLTLIELMVAMVITVIVFLGLTEGILVSVDYNVRNALRDEAVLIGENRMNEIRSLPYDNVVNADARMQPDNVSHQIRAFTVPFTVTPNVVAMDPRQVNVTVAWTWAGKPYTHVFSTIVRRR